MMYAMSTTSGAGADPQDMRDPASHAVLDENSRLAKARKIAALITQVRPLTSARVLEVGCGSGHISRALAHEVGPAGRFQALDVCDVRRADGFDFALYDGTLLPADPESFDIVISNHTIEHVGDARAQLAHVTEIARVLAPGGLVYLAAPNRWFPWEAHYRLPFLGWLPRKVADAWMRSTGRGEHFDVYPLSRGAICRMLRGTGMSTVDRTPEALLHFARFESGSRAASWIGHLPRPLLACMSGLMPTFVFIARKDAPPGR